MHSDCRPHNKFILLVLCEATDVCHTDGFVQGLPVRFVFFFFFFLWGASGSFLLPWWISGTKVWLLPTIIKKVTLLLCDVGVPWKIWPVVGLLSAHVKEEKGHRCYLEEMSWWTLWRSSTKPAVDISNFINEEKWKRRFLFLLHSKAQSFLISQGLGGLNAQFLRPHCWNDTTTFTTMVKNYIFKHHIISFFLRRGNDRNSSLDLISLLLSIILSLILLGCHMAAALKSFSTWHEWKHKAR